LVSGTLLYGPVRNKPLWAGFGGPREARNDGDPSKSATAKLTTTRTKTNAPNGRGPGGSPAPVALRLPEEPKWQPRYYYSTRLDPGAAAAQSLSYCTPLALLPVNAIRSAMIWPWFTPIAPPPAMVIRLLGT